MRRSLILLHEDVRSRLQELSCERQELLSQYKLAISIPVDAFFLILPHTLAVCLVESPYGLLSSKLPRQCTPFHFICKLPLLFEARFVLLIPLI